MIGPVIDVLQSVAIIALGTSVILLLKMRRRDLETAYAQGVAVAGARLIGAAAAELGPEHPLVDRLVERLGSIDTEQNL